MGLIQACAIMRRNKSMLPCVFHLCASNRSTVYQEIVGVLVTSRSCNFAHCSIDHVPVGAICYPPFYGGYPFAHCLIDHVPIGASCYTPFCG